MKDMRSDYPLKLMARVLKVSRSGFYGWLCRSTSERTLSDERLKPLIRELHKRYRETYGLLRLQSELADSGVCIGRDSITRLCKEMGLSCKQKKKFKATTNSAYKLPVATNLL